LPEHGAKDPFTIWSIYAACGLACAVIMFVYHRFARREAK